uniref:3-keto-disaccharide hydrolase n=1 Tax=Stieleria sp. TaxID=2795976 RepID=UPI003568464C
MKLTRLVFAAAIAAFVTMPPVTQAESPDAFQPLFNGENLEGWHGRPHFSPIKLAEMPEEERNAKLAEWQADAEKHWRVENGELVNDGHGAYLVTNQDYRDYELYLEYKTVPLADSGIYLKGTPQVQIWDSTETAKFKLGADKGSGGLWNNSAGAPGKDPL